MHVVIGDYLKHKFGIDVWFCGCDIEVLRFNEAEKELVNDLKMRPGSFHDRLIFLWIEDIADRI
jgi:hypothetical protein